MPVRFLNCNAPTAPICFSCIFLFLIYWAYAVIYAISLHVVFKFIRQNNCLIFDISNNSLCVVVNGLWLHPCKSQFLFLPSENSFLFPSKFMSVNADGTHVLLTAALNTGIERFIYVSTDEVYGASSEEVSICSHTVLVEKKKKKNPKNV